MTKRIKTKAKPKKKSKLTKRGKPRKEPGRKLFDGKDRGKVVAKLEHAFAIGATVKEAIFYANISSDSYYRFCDKYPEFRKRFEGLKDEPILKARETVVKDLKRPEGARWYLARKRRKEFGDRLKVDDDTSRQQLRELKDLVIGRWLEKDLPNCSAVRDLKKRQAKVKEKHTDA